MNSDEFNKWIKEGYEQLKLSQLEMDRQDFIRHEVLGPSVPLFKTDEKELVKKEVKQNQTPKPVQVIAQNRPKPTIPTRPKPTIPTRPKPAIPTKPKATLSALGAQRRAIGQKRTEELTLDEARAYHKYSNQIERELDERLKKTEKDKPLTKDPDVEAMDKKLKSWENNKGPIKNNEESSLK